MAVKRTAPVNPIGEITGTLTRVGLGLSERMSEQS